ncbi:MAG: SGNH/GDSL hydrolase family protein, partial [Anaerolineae bacterium]|nr:SGNH/GDSL hydrolase family protein [Anaerolineae bacterium]
YPVLPELTETARVLYQRGQIAGRDAHMFSKVGDSMTWSPHFLTAFGNGDYTLGEFTALERVIDFFREEGSSDVNTFNRPNYATDEGFSTASALDSMWANAEVCTANESPLSCELRVSNSAFALVMFGTNDVMFFDGTTFDYFLRTVLLEIINADVVPILYTMPIRPEEPEKSWLFNEIIIHSAQDFDLPLINLVAALEPLPGYGVDPNDTLHLTVPPVPDNPATFTDASLQSGYTIRNLVTLQALDYLLEELGILEASE